MFIEAFYDHKEFQNEEKSEKISSEEEELDFLSFKESRKDLSPSQNEYKTLEQMKLS